MVIDRRAFTIGFSAAALTALGRPGMAMARTRFITSARNRLDGAFYVVGLDQSFEVTWKHPLPNRAHAPVPRPSSNTFAMVARRPDRFVEIRHTGDGRKTKHIDAAPGRHFYGHGAFDQTGRYLFLTENDFDRGRGVIGIYDSLDQYDRIDEIPSGGIGPHEVALMPGGRALVVANGGILTHPDQGREKLNLDSMTPSLQMIDVASGQLGQTFSFRDRAFHSLSTRHIAVLDDGRVVVGCQDQAAADTTRPLVFITDVGSGTLRPLQMPDAVSESMAGYVGSVSVSADSRLIAASCPRGNLVALWDSDTLNFRGAAAADDVCGLTKSVDAGTIITTTGTGSVSTIGSENTSGGPAHHPFWQWDNHIALV